MSGNPKFTVLYEKLRGKTFELDKEVISIGRRDGVDICLKDASISGHHADLIRTERDGKVVYILRDNDSSNGTRVNNVPITEQELNNDDLILFGMVEVLYAGGGNSANTGFAQTTHTIDLTSIDSNMSTVPTVSSLNPFADAEQKKHDLITKLLIAGAVLLGLCGVAILVKVAFQMAANGA